MWVRGLKPGSADDIRLSDDVAPRVGAWIETNRDTVHWHNHWSHPVWVRGLKQTSESRSVKRSGVAPRVGAWIETFSRSTDITFNAVAPRVGAWIETHYSSQAGSYI